MVQGPAFPVHDRHIHIGAGVLSAAGPEAHPFISLAAGYDAVVPPAPAVFFLEYR